MSKNWRWHRDGLAIHQPSSCRYCGKVIRRMGKHLGQKHADEDDARFDNERGAAGGPLAACPAFIRSLLGQRRLHIGVYKTAGGSCITVGHNLAVRDAPISSYRLVGVPVSLSSHAGHHRLGNPTP